MTLFIRMRQRRNFSFSIKNRKGYWNVLSLESISNRWEEITGQPDSNSWLNKLRKYAVKNKWTTPFSLLRNYPLKDVARLQKSGKIKIKDVFMFVNNPEEKRALAKFLRREGVEQDTLETLFSPEVLLPLDQNEEPARERDFDLNKRPRLEQDLNQNPAQELDEAGDDGGE